MNTNGWVQLALHLSRHGRNPEHEHNWKQYTLAMLWFSAVGWLLTYAILRLQHLLPLNPQGLGPLSHHLAFNTAVSFTTNTNWQSYAGESTMSYFSQMVALMFHNFVSAAVGISLAAALVRGVTRHSARTIGNFWVDLVPVTYYLLLPICLVFALFLAAERDSQRDHLQRADHHRAHSAGETILLLNAVHHTPAGTPVEVKAAVAGGQLRLSVADRGPGIPPESLARIFDKFVRGPAAPTGGSGLGLTIVKGFVEAHGGAVGADNRPGGGVVFNLTLPQPDPHPSVNPDPERGTNHPDSHRVGH